MNLFVRRACVFVCVTVAVMNFAMIFLINGSPYQHIPDETLSMTIGDATKGANKCEDGCHFSCRRHGCSWYNSPCIDGECPVKDTDFGRASAVPASCQTLEPVKDGKRTNCQLEEVEVAFNKCKYTGEKDLESVGCPASQFVPGDPNNCNATRDGKKRCVIVMSVRWNSENAESVKVYREKSDSLQCANDPALYSSDENGKYRALCNKAGEKEVLSDDKLTQTRTIYTKNSEGRWVKQSQHRTRTIANGKWGDWIVDSEEKDGEH
ncbi:MAG: hypothetical protein LBQ66_13655 [Planctomycetaceae bacterium]|jgi:hypothetical protein|nr:hypothetical protein [Planctomycetaceae bacterium]